MKSTYAFAIALLAHLILAQSAFPGETSIEQSARDFQLARFKAMIEEDTETLDDFLADDLTYTHTNGLSETKSGFLATVKSRSIDYVAMVPRNVEVRVYGDVAVMTGLADVQGDVGERTFKFTLRFLDVSRRVDDNWQLVAWQSVRLPEEED